MPISWGLCRTCPVSCRHVSGSRSSPTVHGKHNVTPTPGGLSLFPGPGTGGVMPIMLHSSHAHTVPNTTLLDVSDIIQYREASLVPSLPDLFENMGVAWERGYREAISGTVDPFYPWASLIIHTRGHFPSFSTMHTEMKRSFQVAFPVSLVAEISIKRHPAPYNIHV